MASKLFELLIDDGLDDISSQPRFQIESRIVPLSFTPAVYKNLFDSRDATLHAPNHQMTADHQTHSRNITVRCLADRHGIYRVTDHHSCDGLSVWLGAARPTCAWPGAEISLPGADNRFVWLERSALAPLVAQRRQRSGDSFSEGKPSVGRYVQNSSAVGDGEGRREIYAIVYSWVCFLHYGCICSEMSYERYRAEIWPRSGYAVPSPGYLVFVRSPGYAWFPRVEYMCDTGLTTSPAIIFMGASGRWVGECWKCYKTKSTWLTFLSIGGIQSKQALSAAG